LLLLVVIGSAVLSSGARHGVSLIQSTHSYSRRAMHVFLVLAVFAWTASATGAASADARLLRADVNDTWYDLPGDLHTACQPKLILLGTDETVSGVLRSRLACQNWAVVLPHPGNFFNGSMDSAQLTIDDLRDLYIDYAWLWCAAGGALDGLCSMCDAKIWLCVTEIQKAYSDTIFYEGSPSYLSNRHAAWEMARVLPHYKDVDFVILIQNPIQLAVAAFWERAEEYGLDFEDFEDVVGQELTLLRRCVHTLRLFVPADGGPSVVCSSLSRQIAMFKQCAEASNAASNDYDSFPLPWYTSLTNVTSLKNGALDPPSWMYDGFILKGLYVDQIANYLCAGASPSQFHVYATSQVYNSTPEFIDNLAGRVGKKTTPLSLKCDANITRSLPPLHDLPRFSVPSHLYEKLHSVYLPFNLLLVEFLDMFKFNYDKRAVMKELDVTH
jgi:hypothetical protein